MDEQTGRGRRSKAGRDFVLTCGRGKSFDVKHHRNLIPSSSNQQNIWRFASLRDGLQPDVGELYGS